MIDDFLWFTKHADDKAHIIDAKIEQSTARQLFIEGRQDLALLEAVIASGVLRIVAGDQTDIAQGLYFFHRLQIVRIVGRRNCLKQDQIMSVGVIDELFGILVVDRERLFQNDMFAMFQSRHRVLIMQGIR